MRGKAGLTAAVAVALLLCVLFGGVLLQYARPMEDADYDLSLDWGGESEGAPEDWVYNQKGWTVFTQEGEAVKELTPDGFGGFFGPVEPGDTFYFSRPLTEELDNPTLRLDTGSHAVAVFLDDILLYTDCPELTGRIGALRLPMLDWERNTALTVALPADCMGKTLTIAQSTGQPEVEREHFTVYPCAVRLYCGYAYESSLIAESFQAAIPAALLFAAGAVLLAAFVFSLVRGGSDTGLLWAALSVFLWMAGLLNQLSFTGKYQGESKMGAYRLLALTALLAFLSSRGGKHRRVLWGVTALSGVSCATALLIEWRSPVLGSSALTFLNISLPELVGMAGLVLALVFGWRFWRKETRFYALFAPLATAGAGLALAWGLIGNGSAIWSEFTAAVAYLLPGYFLWRLMWVCTVAAILSAGTELAEQEIARRTEARMMATHNELALQSYENLRIRNEQMMMMRHDMAKHLATLRQMTDEGQRTAYLDELIGQNKKIRPVVQSGNQMLDILLNGKLSQAISAGVRVELLRCCAPERLPLSDAELCSVVANLLDNAVAAATAPNGKEPYIRLDMHVRNKFFVFQMENSVGQIPQKSPAPGHGLGLRIVHQILENYGDMIEVEQSEGRYRVTLAVPLSTA